MMFLRFLLAKFQLDYVLNFREPTRRNKALKTLPRDIHTAYDEVIHRIENSSASDDKSLALRILGWLYRAQRTLRMDELVDALAIGSYEDYSDEEEDDDTDDTQGFIERNRLQPGQLVECCQSLIQYEQSSGLVRFTHFTVQEFITQKLQQQLPPLRDLAITCISYLSMFDSICSDKNIIEKRIQQYPFSCYAAEFWGVHTKETEDEDDIQQRTMTFLLSKNKRDSMLELDAYTKSRPTVGDTTFDPNQTLLHVLAINGLSSICLLALQKSQDVNNTYTPCY